MASPVTMDSLEKGRVRSPQHTAAAEEAAAVISTRVGVDASTKAPLNGHTSPDPTHLHDTHLPSVASDDGATGGSTGLPVPNKSTKSLNMLSSKAMVDLVSAARADAQEKAKPPLWLLHSALVFGQLCLGGAAVVAKLALADMNLFVFSFIRTAAASLLLAIPAMLLPHPQFPRGKDLMLIIACGVFMFGNQFLYIIGIKLGSATVAASWQPTQPVIVLAISMMLKWEPVSARRIFAIVLASAGATTMAALGPHPDDADTMSMVWSSMALFADCVCAAGLIICSKFLGGRYPPLMLTSSCYLVSSVLMGTTTLVATLQTENAWDMPTEAVYTIGYWVIFGSMVAYGLMLWAIAHVDASFVSVYSCLQPMAAAALSLIAFGEGLTIGAVGILGIVGGLVMVFISAQRAKVAARPSAAQLRWKKVQAVALTGQARAYNVNVTLAL